MIIASIDIGTNTVLLLIAKVDEKTHFISPILNEYRMPRLGKGLIPGGNISADRLIELLKILEEYKALINLFRAEKVLLSATNAFRIAKNAEFIVNKIHNSFKWNVDIISGDEEAEYAFLGAMSGLKNETEGLVIDIGGGSTELIFGSGENIKFKKSFQTGSVSATERFLTKDPPEEELIKEFERFLTSTFNELKNMNAPHLIIAVSGTPTTLSCMIKGLKAYDDNLIEGSILRLDTLSSLIAQIRFLSSKQISEKFGSVMNGREDIILAGVFILFNIMKLLKLPEVIVSSRGIRYGAISSYLTRTRN